MQREPVRTAHINMQVSLLILSRQIRPENGSKIEDLLTQRETALAKATTLSTTANMSKTLHCAAAGAPPYMMYISSRDGLDRHQYIVDPSVKKPGSDHR